MIELGDKVKDRITGLEGIVVAKTEWINGCIRLSVQPQEIKDGKPVECSAFDIEELELITAGVLQAKTRYVTNGPMPHPGGSR